MGTLVPEQLSVYATSTVFSVLRVSEILFAVTLLCASHWGDAMTEIESLASQPQHCTYEYAYDMYGAHCAGLRMSNIPRLRGGIEILDFSDNKLQELQSDTLSGYSSIKFLYLADNHIYLISDDAFTSLTSLETLDLSNNVILELPDSMFQMPSLRKLYLKGNPIFHKSSNDLTIQRPIKAPLELLDISDCKIKQLPDWGMLPQLLFYNISHNPLLSLNTDHFSTMCNLAKVDLTDSINNIQLCSIKSAIMWLTEKKVYFHLGDYAKLNTRAFQNCPVEDNSVHNVTYHTCKTEYLQVQSIKTSRRTWLTIGGGLAGFLIGFILLLYVMHRHNVAQTKTTAEKIKQATPAHDTDKNATAVLLNENEVSYL